MKPVTANFSYMAQGGAFFESTCGVFRRLAIWNRDGGTEHSKADILCQRGRNVGGVVHFHGKRH